MFRNMGIAPLLAALLALGACASAGSGGGRSGSQTVITAEELAGVPELSAFEAVQRLRPQWLATRGRVSFSTGQGIRLYVDGVSRGYLGDLSSIRATSVERMRFLSAREATARFGTDHVDGAILVDLK